MYMNYFIYSPWTFQDTGANFVPISQIRKLKLREVLLIC